MRFRVARIYRRCDSVSPVKTGRVGVAGEFGDYVDSGARRPVRTGLDLFRRPRAAKVYGGPAGRFEINKPVMIHILRDVLNLINYRVVFPGGIIIMFQFNTHRQ